MGELVNLRRFRKRRARDAEAERAAQERAAHGLGAGARDAAAAAVRRADARLDGHRRTPTDDAPPR